MKILHTADWHIGKKLHKHELAEDFNLFTNWLTNLIQSEKIELLLISGDIFDLANPSSEARKQYYQALIKLQKLNCRIIATGGNHDSPAMLDAPREILQALDMDIIGGLPENLEDCVLPIKDKNGKIEVVVAAIPYLRDANLRSGNVSSTYDDRIEALRDGIKGIFENASQICRDKYCDIPVIAMGHLFTAKIDPSDSERDIQIGNLAAFQAHHFGNHFNYIALGHIHKPQQVKADIPVFYSGSPLPLSFSERSDEKRVLVLDTSKDWNPVSFPIPNFRRLIKISGNLNTLSSKLNSLPDHTDLDSLIEIDLEEEQYDAQKIYALDTLVNSFQKSGYEIVKQRANFKNKIKGSAEVFSETQQLEDLKPREIFMELIAQHEYDEEHKNEILSAFDEILEEVEQSENYSR